MHVKLISERKVLEMKILFQVYKNLRNLLIAFGVCLLATIGNTQEKQNFMKESLSWAQKQIDENPGRWMSVVGYWNKGVAYKDYGYQDQANEMFKKAETMAAEIIAKDSTGDEAFRAKLTLAKMYFYTIKDYSVALKRYEELLSQWSTYHLKDSELVSNLPTLFIRSYLNIGESHAFLGDTTSALAAYEKAVSSQISSPDKETQNILKEIAQYRIGELYQKIGLKKEAIKAYKKVINDYPDNLESNTAGIEDYKNNKEKAKEQTQSLSK